MVICLECGANDLHGPADATATPPSLASVKSRMVYLSGASLPRKKAIKLMYVCLTLLIDSPFSAMAEGLCASDCRAAVMM